MIIFPFFPYEGIASAFLKSNKNQLGEFVIAPYRNGELHCELNTKVRNSHCLIVSSFVAGNELGPLLLSETLKQEGAKKITLVAPYLGYMRQDKKEPGKNLGATWIGKLFKASGVDKIVTVDIHSDLASKLLGLPVNSLSGSTIFADELGAFLGPDTMIIAPDDGAFNKAKSLAKSLPISLPVTHFDKVRTSRGVTITPPRLKLRARVILIDDVLDTGGTLVAACQILKDKGVKDIVICITHGQFVGEKWEGLWKLGVSKIYTTNSLPSKVKNKKIQVVSLQPLFERAKI